MLWVIVFVTTERKTSSTANDTTGSSPVQCSSGTTQIRTKESSFPARKTLAKSSSHRRVGAYLYNGILPESEWKKNLRMDRDVFIALADEIRPYLQPGRSPRGLDVLSVEKQLALTLYVLKDQGSLSMTANAFGIARCTVSAGFCDCT